MPGFTQVFGGTTIAPAQATFLQLNIAADVDLAWPIEQAINGNVVADTIEVNASAPGLNVDLPDARQVTTGYTTLFNNTGANTVTIRNAIGGNLLSLVSGTAWVLYLSDNSTEGGTWRTFQLGASVSVAVAAALAGAGLRAITTTLNQDIPITNTAVTPTTFVGDDRAKYINWTGGLGTFNLPTAGTVGNGWFIQIRNSGSGDLTVAPPAGTIDGAATKTFAAGTSATVVTDGADYFTLGFGSGSGGAGSFDFVEINVAGSGNFTLSGANLNRIAYRFIGILTGNRTIIVPNAIQQYWIANATTGAFSLYIRTAGQTPPGIEVLQNNQNIMYCDGTNVIDAESSTVSFPIPVAQGGTGAVTAATARTNLGAGVTGSNIFIAATQADAQSALGMGLALSNTFTLPWTATLPPIKLSSINPVLEFNETDAVANNRLWRLAATGEAFQVSAADDADTSATVFFEVQRTANVIDSLRLQATVLLMNGIVTTPNVSSDEVGYKGIPRFSKGANYTLVLTDAGVDIYHPLGIGAITITIPSNAAVPFPGGTVVFVTNMDPSPVTININTDTLILSGNGATGPRSLAQYGEARIRKVDTTTWLISGTGLT